MAAVPQAIIKKWAKSTAMQVVGQCEIAHVLLARRTWPSLLKEANVVYWLDQDAARFALIKGYSPSPGSADLIGQCAVAEVDLGSCIFFARVPTDSNVGDPASRMNPEGVSAVLPDAVMSPANLPEWWK